MAAEQKTGQGTKHVATAQMRSIPISTKHSIEISRYLRYKSSTVAKAFLEDVVILAKPVPYKKFLNDLGHKAGMSSGRYPVKAASAFLTLIKSVEKNAEDVGLDPSSLKIVHILANKASIPMTGGRTKGATKRTHLEIKVAEVAKKAKGKKSAAKSKPVSRVENKPVEKVETTKVETAKPELVKTEVTTEGEVSSTNTNQDTAKGEAQ